MREHANRIPKLPLVEVTLDGNPIRIGPEMVGSLAGIRSRLESLALLNQRVLFGLEVDGVPVSLTTPMVKMARFQKIQATTIGFDQLRQQLGYVAVEQIESLKGRIQSLSLVVLINDWPKARALWWNLVPELKEPMLTLSFLSELDSPNEPKSGKKPLPWEALRSAKVDELGRILGHIESACSRAQSFGLSDALETLLLPWLDQLAKLIQAWCEPDGSADAK